MVGLPEVAFYELVNLCEEPWRENPILATNGHNRPVGRPRPCDISRRYLNCRDTIGLVLRWLTSCQDRFDVAKEFGLVESDGNKYLVFGIQVMLSVLREHDFAQMSWKTNDLEYLNRMAEHMKNYVPELENYDQKIVGYLDGVRFRIVNKWIRPKDQKEDYSGEKKYALRKILIIFDPLGRIVAAVWNCPGKWNDSKCTRRGALYRKIDELPEGYSIVADSAFKGKILGSKVLRILREGELLPVGMDYDELQERERVLIRARQPSEWGNNTLVQFIKRLRQCLSGDDKFNQHVMELSLLLHNFRVHYSDRNQLKKFFLNLEQDESDADGWDVEDDDGTSVDDNN